MVSGVWRVAGCCLGAGLAGCRVVGVLVWVCPEGLGWVGVWGVAGGGLLGCWCVCLGVS